MENEKVGYARVSTREQNLDLQIEALRKYGVSEDHLWIEKLSAASKNRPELDMAIKDLRPGDTFVVWRIDRIARSMQELYRRLEEINEAGAAFKSLTENFDFTTASGKFILGILGLVAEFERQLTVERTQAGIESAKARGIKFGRKRTFTDQKLAQAFVMLTDKGMSARQVAEHFGVKPGTIYKYFKFTTGPDGARWVEYKEIE